VLRREATVVVKHVPYPVALLLERCKRKPSACVTTAAPWRSDAARPCSNAASASVRCASGISSVRAEPASPAAVASETDTDCESCDSREQIGEKKKNGRVKFFFS